MFKLQHRRKILKFLNSKNQILILSVLNALKIKRRTLLKLELLTLNI